MRARNLGFSLLVIAATACGGGQDGDDDDVSGGVDGGVADATPADARPVGPPTAIAFPQALDGAMWVNPVIYAAPPVRLRVEGGAERVSVRLGGGALVDAVATDGGGVEWVAALPVTMVQFGSHTVHAAATGRGVTLEATVELHIGNQGVQLTDFGADGGAASPRLHRRGAGELWITWCDRSAGPRQPFLRRIDGAGRWQGDKVALMADRAEKAEILYARAAFGEGGEIGILYQTSGGPYENWFTVVGDDGSERLAPVPLDPPGRLGSFGGELVHVDGSYYGVFRTNDGMGGGQVHWFRWDEVEDTMVGPILVAASGDSMPEGGIPIFSPVSIGVSGGNSLVAFVRERYDAVLDFDIPKAQVALIDPAGQILVAAYAGVENDFTWHHEARVATGASGFSLIWSSQDLTSPETTPPTRFFIADADPATGAFGLVKILVDAPEHRVEPYLLPLDGDPALLGHMAWLDERSYVDLQAGKIELWAGAVGKDLAMAGEPAVFNHPRFIEGTSELRAFPVGSNSILIWLDERHGGGVVNPKPELWFETAWF